MMKEGKIDEKGERINHALCFIVCSLYLLLILYDCQFLSIRRKKVSCKLLPPFYPSTNILDWEIKNDMTRNDNHTKNQFRHETNSVYA